MAEISIKERLEGLQGAAYYEEWRRIWQEIRDEAIAAVQYVREEREEYTERDLVQLADMLGTPFKPLVEWLEAENILTPGTYAALRASGFSLRRTRDAIAEDWEEEMRWRRRVAQRESATARRGSLTPIGAAWPEEEYSYDYKQNAA